MESQYYKRTILKETILSTHLNAERSIRIFLPPGFNELLTYPVIYCQDGEQFFNFGRIATHMTQLILDEDLEPCIIVGVDVNVDIRTSEYAPDGERFLSYCNFFVEELLPYIEEKYPVRTDREHRILAGDSLGGTVSLHLALDYRSLFSQVISLSGAFFQTTQRRIEQENDLSWLKLYMLIGLQETEVQTPHRGTFDFLQYNRETRDMLVLKDTQLRYIEKDGVHLWGFWQKELPDALRHFLR